MINFTKFLENVGKRISANEIYDWVVKNHYNKGDLVEGNLSDRIFKYNYYVLQDLSMDKIDVEEWNSHDETVEKYKQLYLKTKDYPSIVYDSIDESIIDGTHRARALKELGIKIIKAYVGHF